MQNFRALRVWQQAHELTLAAYKTTRTFPKSELYGLTAQVREAAASMCANIAEGCGRGGGADFARFLQIAFGSASELECHLILAFDLEYLDQNTYDPLVRGVADVKRMLTGLIRKVRQGANEKRRAASSNKLAAGGYG